jgi:hypothetical protein
MAAFVAVRDVLSGSIAGRGRVLRTLALAAVLVVASAAWTVRVVAQHYSLRYHAFLNRGDWAREPRWEDPDESALGERLRAEVLAKPVPNPFFDPEDVVDGWLDPY